MVENPKPFLLFLHAPNDRQNVPAVLNLVKSLKACIIFHQNSDDQVCCKLLASLKILEKIYDGIVCLFSSPKIFSTLSQVLYHQYQAHGISFIPGQLYHDLQRMVQASFYLCALYKVRGGGKFYLYQLETDQLEMNFNSARTITHARNCNQFHL